MQGKLFAMKQRGSNLQLWLWGPEAEAWFKGFPLHSLPPSVSFSESCSYPIFWCISWLVVVIFFSVLQGSVGEYCVHNCKSAPVVIVPGKGMSLPFFWTFSCRGGLEFWRCFISLVGRCWRCVNHLVMGIKLRFQLRCEIVDICGLKQQQLQSRCCCGGFKTFTTAVRNLKPWSSGIRLWKVVFYI